MNNTKFTETEVNSMRNRLQKLIQTLQNNKEQVPAKVLQTKYKKSYFSLIDTLKQISSDYAGYLILHVIRILRAYLDEVTALIKRLMDSAGILPQLSAAVFQQYDINQFEALAESLRTGIKEELDLFYGRYSSLLFSEKCLEAPAIIPEIYCPVNGCFWLDGKSIPAEDTEKTQSDKSVHS